MKRQYKKDDRINVYDSSGRIQAIVIEHTPPFVQVKHEAIDMPPGHTVMAKYHEKQCRLDTTPRESGVQPDSAVNGLPVFLRCIMASARSSGGLTTVRYGGLTFWANYSDIEPISDRKPL